MRYMGWKYIIGGIKIRKRLPCRGYSSYRLAYILAEKLVAFCNIVFYGRRPRRVRLEILVP
jgi:hypothetical protein